MKSLSPHLGLMSPTEQHIKILSEEKGIFSTGNWPISKSKIDDLVGKDLIVVKGSKKPAYVGGKIIDYKFIRKDIDKLGREKMFWAFTFENNESYKGYEDHYDIWNSRSIVRYLK